MQKPTAIVKPEFIANVDTANEEVARLVDQYNALVVGFNEQVTASENLLTEANTAKQTAETALTKLKETSAEELKAANDKADAAAKAAQQAIAAAGIETPVKAKGTNALDADNKTGTEGLTGLARAMQANINLQKK